MPFLGGQRLKIRHIVVVNKLMGSEGTVNVRVVRKTASPDGGSPDNRYDRLVLPLTDGDDITLTRTRPFFHSQRGFTWRGATEATGERATLMLWNDGHLSG